MILRINRGVANGNSYCYWSVDSGQIYEGGIYHDREWSAIFGRQVTIKEKSFASVDIVLGEHSKRFNFGKVFSIVSKSEEAIEKELCEIRKTVLEWFDTIDFHENFTIELAPTKRAQ
ncbi:MAG: hypothetical protein Q8Q03_03105 [bacterium]|nr:hypothetical protein [bacterium]